MKINIYKPNQQQILFQYQFYISEPQMQYMARDLLPKREKALTTLTKLVSYQILVL